MPGVKLHHVVYCVRPEHQDEAVAFWSDLGCTFVEIPLVAEGIRVFLDWSSGVEIIAPAEQTGTETARFQAFLDEKGEGTYAVVVRTDEVDGPTNVATRYGAKVCYQQHRVMDGTVIDEVDLTPVRGMAVTLLATDLPD
jgi:methylmalonyl-CoA/ethylmalonyl-CoA epimerase